MRAFVASALSHSPVPVRLAPAIPEPSEPLLLLLAGRLPETLAVRRLGARAVVQPFQFWSELGIPLRHAFPAARQVAVISLDAPARCVTFDILVPEEVLFQVVSPRVLLHHRVVARGSGLFRLSTLLTFLVAGEVLVLATLAAFVELTHAFLP